eukprot:scaffold2885_cov93-Isochrysis_galbana.AAC.3
MRLDEATCTFPSANPPPCPSLHPRLVSGWNLVGPRLNPGSSCCCPTLPPSLSRQQRRAKCRRTQTWRCAAADPQAGPASAAARAAQRSPGG